MKSRSTMFAPYNVWANERLHDAAARLSDTDYRADRGAFFKSVHGTLNHLLLGDRIWMRRFTGRGDHPAQLGVILHDTFAELRAARRAEDARITDWIAELGDADIAGTLRYRTVVNPRDIEQPLAPARDHLLIPRPIIAVRAHCLLTGILGNDPTPSLDLIVFQRETGHGGLKST